MRIMILIFSLLSYVANIQAQGNIDKQVYYRCVVELAGDKITKGYLLGVKDSSIVLQSLKNKRILEELSYSDIHTIRLKRKNKIPMFMAGGAAIGVLGGLMTGQMLGDDDPGFWSMTAQEKSKMYAVLFLWPGAVIGGVLGTATDEIEIRQSWDLFQLNRPHLIVYSYVEE